MDHERTAAATGAAAAALTGLLTAVPYLLALPETVALYYGGAVNPPLAGLFGVVAAIVLAAGATGRTDRATAAGIAVVLAGFAALIAVGWAVSTGRDAAATVSAARAFDYHRWLVAGSGVAALAGAGWYARAVLGE